jgi:hypothetical protein
MAFFQANQISKVTSHVIFLRNLLEGVLAKAEQTKEE